MLEDRGYAARPQASLLLLQGHNEPEEINALIWLTVYFKHTESIGQLLARWRDSDEPLQELQNLAGDIYACLQLAPRRKSKAGWPRSTRCRFNFPRPSGPSTRSWAIHRVRSMHGCGRSISASRWRC